MDTAKRMQLIRIIEKIEKNPEFSEKLGIRNTSVFEQEEEQKRERKK